MSMPQPSIKRPLATADNSSLKITIPGPKNYLSLFVIGILLIACTVGEFIVIQIFKSALNISNWGRGLFWTFFWGYWFYRFLWLLQGKEYIEVGHDALKIQRVVFGFEKIKEYSAIRSKNLRLSVFLELDIRRWFWGTHDGDLAFDYDSKTIRFGSGAEVEEASHLLQEIFTRFPQYKR